MVKQRSQCVAVNVLITVFVYMDYNHYVVNYNEMRQDTINYNISSEVITEANLSMLHRLNQGAAASLPDI